MAPEHRSTIAVDQGGDTSIGQAAGENIIHGADPETMAAIASEAMATVRAAFLDDSRRDARQAETDTWRRSVDRALSRLAMAMLAAGAALFLQTIILAVTLAALVSLLWPRLAALVR